MIAARSNEVVSIFYEYEICRHIGILYALACVYCAGRSVRDVFACMFSWLSLKWFQ